MYVVIRRFLFIFFLFIKNTKKRISKKDPLFCVDKTKNSCYIIYEANVEPDDKRPDNSTYAWIIAIRLKSLRGKRREDLKNLLFFLCSKMKLAAVYYFVGQKANRGEWMILEVRNATYNKEKASCRYDFYFEKKTNTLHIRDQNRDLSVTEQLNLQPYSFIYHIRLQFENAFNFKLPIDCKIYVYTRDSIVYEWRDNVMKLIPSEKMNTAHPPYLKRKRERDQRAYPQ